MKDGAILLGLFALIPSFSNAAGGPPPNCSNSQAALTADEAKYKAAFAADEQEGDQLKDDSSSGLSGKVSWADETIIFNVPSVTITDETMVFGVPQVTVHTQHIIFDTPSVRVVPLKTGQYPETTCHDTWIEALGIKTKGVPACTVTWSDIVTDVPEPFMQHQDIQMGIPEFTWADTKIIAGIPQVTMEPVKWVIGLPQFTVTSVVLGSKKLSDEGTNLRNDVDEKKAQMAVDVGADIHSMFSCYRASISNSRAATFTQFNVAISQIDASIQSIKASGGDPTNVKDSTGKTSNLVALETSLSTQRDDALTTFDKALKQLDDSEKTAIAKLVSS